MVLTNPPFGKKSSVTDRQRGGRARSAKRSPSCRDDFWATTSNKQLNFLQHVKTLLKMNGRAAVVVPDNVLFEGGAGETIRRKLLQSATSTPCSACPPASSTPRASRRTSSSSTASRPAPTPWTRETLGSTTCAPTCTSRCKTNPLQRADLDDFVACYQPENRHNGKQTWSDGTAGGPLALLPLRGALQRDKLSLDIFWLKDDSLDDGAALADPDAIAGRDPGRPRRRPGATGGDAGRGGNIDVARKNVQADAVARKALLTWPRW